MLFAVLQAIETTGGPVHLGELSRQLGIDKQALAGMVDFWVRKGRVVMSGRGETACPGPAGQSPPAGACSCAGAAGCPFSMT